VKGKGALVPEAPRMVQKPVLQAAPKVVRKQKGEGETEETKCCQKAEKELPVLELISSNRGADALFSPPTRGRG